MKAGSWHLLQPKVISRRILTAKGREDSQQWSSELSRVNEVCLALGGDQRTHFAWHVTRSLIPDLATPRLPAAALLCPAWISHKKDVQCEFRRERS